MSVVSKLYAWQYYNRQRYVNWRCGKQLQSTKHLTLVAEPQRVLFVVAGLLGDAVMSTPAIIAARRIWQNAHFTLLGQKHNLDLLRACPFINEFYETPVIPFSIKRRKAENQLKSWLKSGNFDVGIVLSGGQFGAVLAQAAIPVRVAGKHHQTSLPNCFTHLYEDGAPRTWGPVEQLNAVRILGYNGETILPQLWVEEKARETAVQKLHALGLSENQRYAVVHPFGSTHRQWWQLQNVAPLAESLKLKYDLPTVLVGGKETVANVTPEIKAAVVDTTGQLNLPELLAVLDESEFVVTTDSGPFHIAGALRKTIVGLFRASRPEHAWHYPNTSVLFGENATCQSVCQWNRCRADPCAQVGKIADQAVLKSVESLLAQTDFK